MLKTSGPSLALASVSIIDKVREALAKAALEAAVELGVEIECALDVLRHNGLNPLVFAGYIRELLISGQGKFRNLMIHSRSNCAKTFILKPLKTIFCEKVFNNPANGKYASVGADKAEIILLQDFRYSKDVITWKDLLLLLEGETVRLPAPKNHFSTDIVIESDVPIFATTKSPIIYRGPYNIEDERETEMMNNRWRMIHFHYVFQREQQRDIKPCGRCFAELVLMENDQGTLEH